MRAGNPCQLGDEAGLPDARLAEDGHDFRRALGDHSRERVAKAAEFRFAPDERAVEPAPDRRSIVLDVSQ